MKKQKKPVPPAEAEPVIKKQPLLKRLLFGPERPDLSELEAGSTTILDILSPTAIDTKSRDYIVVDGVFHAYLYITGYGYSTTAGSCWLAPLVEAGEGVNVSFSFTRQNREKILSKIAQTTMLNRSRMRDVGDTRQDYEELDSAITSGLYLKDVMNRQGEDFYYMHTLIEVVADDPDTLEQRVTAVEKLCVSVDMIARRCDYANEQGFLSTLPLVTLDADIERKSRRNALTTGVAAAFPFVSYEHSDRNGIFLGLNLYNKSPVFLDPYDDYKYTNGNWWIGGNSGAGKSVTLQCLAGRLREQGKRNTGQDVTAIWIFDPIRNWLAIFSGFGLKATAFFVLMFCLVTKRGYLWFFGYKYTRDPRGFDILPDGTHGSSGFLTKCEMEAFLEIGPIRSVSGMLLGKIKERPEDPDKYAAYVAHRMVPGENNNLLCIGAPGSWKTRGLILPFLMGCAQRKESVFCVDPKGELFEQLLPSTR